MLLIHHDYLRNAKNPTLQETEDDDIAGRYTAEHVRGRAISSGLITFAHTVELSSRLLM